MPLKTYVMADIHGQHTALMQCLERAEFDFENDRLIQLGDVSDRGPATAQCVETLMKIRHLVPIRGNHDCWTHDYFVHSLAPGIWLTQGGYETIQSYVELSYVLYGEDSSEIHPELLQRHRQFYMDQLDWYIDSENRLFVHGGWDYRAHPMDFERAAGQPMEGGGEVSRQCHWDRSLFIDAKRGNPAALKELTVFSEVYIGHTYHDTPPYYQIENLYNLDTGAGRGWVLTLLNLETKEAFTSDWIDSA